MTTEKISVAYRLSDQALDNLDAITQATGTTKTAAVEMALGLLAKQLTITNLQKTLDETNRKLGDVSWDNYPRRYGDLLRQVYTIFIELAKTVYAEVDKSIIKNYPKQTYYLDVKIRKIIVDKPVPYLNTRYIKIYDGQTKCHVFDQEIREIKEWYCS
jgi:hypothetical protein